VTYFYLERIIYDLKRENFAIMNPQIRVVSAANVGDAVGFTVYLS